MRIAIDIRSLMEGRHSGVEEYTVEIIKAFGRVAPQHEYHLFYNAGRPITLPQMPEGMTQHGFRYPNKLFNAAQWLTGLPQWNKLVGADCFFVPSLRLMPLSKKIPLVTTVHDLSFERFPELFSWRRRFWHRLMRPRRLMEVSQRLIAVSHATAHDLTQLYGIPRSKISVIYPGITSPATPISSVQVSQVKEKYVLPDRFVLFLGTLEPRKNIPSIIRAFSAIAESVSHDLVLAGAPGWLTHDLTRALQESPVKARIHLPGFIEQSDKAALYAAADLFVYPSFYEGFGFPPLEALSVGTPVVTSRNSSLPEIVGKWAHLIDPHDPGELAMVLRELLSETRRVPKHVSAQVRSSYQWDVTGRHTLQVLERVAVY